MRVKAIAVAAAIAFVSAVGAASAAENFSTLNGIPAEPLSAAEMEAVKGAFRIRIIFSAGKPLDMFPNGITINGSDTNRVICAGPVDPGPC